MVMVGTVFPTRIAPLNNIQPFTYRDGMSHLQLLEKLRVYINDTMRVEFSEELERIISEFNVGSDIWQAAFDQFIVDITANIAELNKDGIGLALADLFINPANAPYNVDFTGNTDPVVVAANTAGLQAALDAVAANGGGMVWAPKGVCVFAGDVNIGSLTVMRGAGEAVTTFRVHDSAGWNERGFIFPAGTHHSALTDLTVDGNQGPRNHDDGLGGIMGTSVSIVNSTYIRVERVTTMNSMQHGFDATSPFYAQNGDGGVSNDPSEHIWFTDCTALEHGDDGFSTHGSGKIWFTRCVAGGTWYRNIVRYANTNGFEVDDYSYDVTLTDCRATDNAHGFEVKAHGDQSAGRNVRMIGCVAEKNQVNFSLRHIGHHMASHPRSLTAKSVQLIGCTSRFPTRTFFGGADQSDGDVPDDQTPLGEQYSHLVIGAYRGVTVTNFHCISDPTFNYAGAPAILLHFKCENITIDGYHIEGHTTGAWDIQATGGGQPAAYITIVNGMHQNSAIGGISTGAASQAIVMNNRFNRTVALSPNGVGIAAFGNKIVRGNQFITPYNKNYNISSGYYDEWDTPLAANTPVTAPV